MMKVAVFSTKPYDKIFFNAANESHKHELTFTEAKLTKETVTVAEDYLAICCFVNDELNRDILSALAKGKTKLIALRSAGFNNVDLTAAKELGITIVRVPAYSPYAVAEFAVGLILCLNRKIHKAYAHTREHDFSLHGLLGFDLHPRTVGIIGTGRIGTVFAKIMHGIGCKLLAYDVKENDACKQLGVKYVNLDELYSQADIISLHCPLTPETHHIINHEAIDKMKDGVMIVNTSRGATIDTRAIIDGLKSGKIGHLGIDVYEEEENIFFEDLSDKIIKDDLFTRLETFPNVLITGHQGFFTEDALRNIASTTLKNISAFEQGSGEIFTVE